MKFYNLLLIVLAISIIWSCQSDPTENLRESLTFYASFDQEEADFAMGDKAIYFAPSRRAMDSMQTGIANGVHSWEQEGKWGKALRFMKRADPVLFFKSANNINYDSQDWSGSLSFWLKLDPAKDLEPGYTDPIQITDVRYNDASIWVDFTNENPRDFRLGVIGDLASWVQDTAQTSAQIEFEKRLVPVSNPPFTGEKWTHVAVVFQSLGTVNSRFELFLNGESQGMKSGIDDPFTWELEKSNIYLGLGFVGLMDDLAIFNRPLTNEEVLQLTQMKQPFKF